jgi:hypothetical protein
VRSSHPEPELATIAETQVVSSIVDEAVSKYPFAQEVFDAAKWRIARDKNIGVPLPDISPHHFLVFITSMQIARSPSLLVRFSRKRESSCDITIDWAKFLPYDQTQSSKTPSEYIVLG